MNRTRIALFNIRADAEPLRQRLVQSGIPAEIHEELRLERLWFVSRPATGTRLEVPSDRFEEAYELLLKWDAAESALRQAIRCPECRSLRVDYPQFTRKFFIPNLVMGTLATIGAVEKEYYCEDCHCTWPREGVRHSAVRPHAAPYYFIEGIEQTTLPPSEDKRHAA